MAVEAFLLLLIIYQVKPLKLQKAVALETEIQVDPEAEDFLNPVLEESAEKEIKEAIPHLKVMTVEMDNLSAETHMGLAAAVELARLAGSHQEMGEMAEQANQVQFQDQA